MNEKDRWTRCIPGLDDMEPDVAAAFDVVASHVISSKMCGQTEAFLYAGREDSPGGSADDDTQYFGPETPNCGDYIPPPRLREDPTRTSVPGHSGSYIPPETARNGCAARRVPH